MAEKMFLVPAGREVNGAPLLVRDPLTMAPLPPEGAAKPKNGFWLRRLKDGDVVLARPPRALPDKED